MPRGIFKRKKRKKKNGNSVVAKLQETIKQLQTALTILKVLEKEPQA